MSGTPLLDVRGLTTRFHLQEGTVHAVEDVSFSVWAGQRFGLVGESGSGKTVTALSIMGLVDEPGRIEAGQVLLGGHDLLQLSENGYRQVRGSRIAMIFQDPLSSLNPVMRIGDQLVETIRTHRQVSKDQARARAAELLAEVGMPRPHERLDDYPHQLSGGMRQRVGIALALSCDPELLLADEPTTALDVTIQAQILDLLQRLAHDRGTAVILITHDLGVIAGFADAIAVMYAGRVVEQAGRDALFYRSAHPYTRGLLEAVSRLDRPRAKQLDTIPGRPPSLLNVPPGCAFHPRCFLRRGRPRCVQDRPALRPVGGRGERVAACHYAEELDGVAR